MRKILHLLLILALLCPRAAAAERGGCIALAFSCGESEECTGPLLEALRQRDIRATFFLETCASAPELAEEIAAQGHELGLFLCPEKQPAAMSRRALAGELAQAASQLPKNAPARLLHIAKAPTDGLRQVAKVRGISFIPGIPASAGSIRDGDILLLRVENSAALREALNRIDLLREHGFALLSVSDLARRRNVLLRAGETYRSFPAKER